MSQTWFSLQTTVEDHMWLDFPLSILWQRHGCIYLNSAVGSIAENRTLESSYYLLESPNQQVCDYHKLQWLTSQQTMLNNGLANNAGNLNNGLISCTYDVCMCYTMLEAYFVDLQGLGECFWEGSHAFFEFVFNLNFFNRLFHRLTRPTHLKLATAYAQCDFRLYDLVQWREAANYNGMSN